jgi:hypothetical protein
LHIQEYVAITPYFDFFSSPEKSFVTPFLIACYKIATNSAAPDWKLHLSFALVLHCVC